MTAYYRFGWGALGAAALLSVLLGYNTTQAQNITGFQNGYLTFTNENPALYYRIECKPNLTDPVDWDGSFRGLRNIHSLGAEVTVPVGMFFRVVGRETPWVSGTALASDLLSGRTAYVDDEEFTGTMPNVGQQNVTPGTTAQTITQGYHDGTGEVAGDANLAAENIKKDVTIFGVTGTHESVGGGDTYNAAVPKTGQTMSYGMGDDGALQKGVAWPDPRFTDHGNGTVTDNLTGLMWVKAPHLLSGNANQRTWGDALIFCNALIHANYSDWRLPNVRELLSLVDYDNYDPALPHDHHFTIHFGLGYWYWSSTSSAGLSEYAWIVGYGIGFASNGGTKTTGHYVWPVRAGQ